MAVPAQNRVTELCAMFGDAATGARPWLDVTSALRDAFEVELSTIEIFDKKTGQGRVASDVLDAAAAREYAEHFYKVNPRIFGWGRPRIYTVYPERKLDPEVVARAGEYYDWLHRWRLPRWVAGGPVIDNEDYLGLATVHTSAAHGPTDPATEDALQRLLPVVGNALHVELALAKRGEPAEALDLVGFDDGRAYALLGDDGRVREASAGFVRMLEDNGMIRLRRGALEAEREADRKGLGRLIAAVRADGGAAPPPVRIRPAARGQGLLLRAIPLDRGRDLFERLRPAALLTLTDLDAPAAARAAELRTLWGLTPREADLALALAQGASLAQAARGLGIGEGTARHHLKSIFRRMDIDRQADLVRLVAKLGG